MGKTNFKIIYEDNHLLVVDKPAGMLVQGDATGDEPLLEKAKKYIKEKYNKPGDVFLGTVHRIDRPVSGVVLFARTSKALERLNKQFKNRNVQKIYWAVTKEKPASKKGTLTHYLIKDTNKNKVSVFDEPKDKALKATLHYKVLGNLNKHFLIEVTPVTGRPHQIRAQLAAMGCPIRGDLKYGFHKPNSDASINLHAKHLTIEHPTKKGPITFTAPLPEDEFWGQFLALEDFRHTQVL